MNAMLQIKCAANRVNDCGTDESGQTFMAKRSKKQVESKVNYRSLAMQQLQIFADRTRTDASLEDDAWLASLSRIIDALALYATKCPSDVADIQAVEIKLAGVLLKHGLPAAHTRTIRMRRGSRLGQPRSIWASGLRDYIEMGIRHRSVVTARHVAIEIANALAYDWPGESGPFTAATLEKMIAVIEGALPTNVTKSDVEAMIQNAVNALQIPGGSGLFGFADKQSQRVQKRNSTT